MGIATSDSQCMAEYLPSTGQCGYKERIVREFHLSEIFSKRLCEDHASKLLNYYR